jgi:methionine-rich copper-binding protein CopC
MKAMKITSSGRIFLTFLIAAGLYLTNSPLYAQHNHGYQYSGSVEFETIPEDDAVLPEQPRDLILQFSEPVTLMKLTLRNDFEKMINIDFRYNPTPSRVFIWPLPDLPASDYYQIDWTALDSKRIMMVGQFYFSAGPDAVAPSTLVDDEEETLKVPDYRLSDLSTFTPPENAQPDSVRIGGRSQQDQSASESPSDNAASQ